MDRLPDRIDGALALAAAGALLLLVSLFLDWYEPGLSALNVFEVVDLGLAAVAVVSLVLAWRASTVEPGYEQPETDWLLWLGGGAFAVVLFEVIDNPPAVAGRGVEAGAWLALIGALAILAGSILYRSRVSLVLTLRPREHEPAAAPGVPAASGTRAQPAGAAVEPEPVTGEEDVIVPDPYEPPAPAAPPAEAPSPAAAETPATAGPPPPSEPARPETLESAPLETDAPAPPQTPEPGAPETDEPAPPPRRPVDELEPTEQHPLPPPGEQR